MVQFPFVLPNRASHFLNQCLLTDVNPKWQLPPYAATPVLPCHIAFVLLHILSVPFIEYNTNYGAADLTHWLFMISFNWQTIDVSANLAGSSWEKFWRLSAASPPWCRRYKIYTHNNLQSARAMRKKKLFSSNGLMPSHIFLWQLGAIPKERTYLVWKVPGEMWQISLNLLRSFWLFMMKIMAFQSCSHQRLYGKTSRK